MMIMLGELRSLQLLREAQTELREALNELGGQPGDGLLQHYFFYTAVHINRAAEGYIYLRESKRFDASKLLVRTALEALIRVQAVRRNPESLFRIAFTEFQEDKKWVRPFNSLNVEDATQVIDRQWQEFRRAYHETYPEHPLTEEKLSVHRAAELARLDRYYDSHYRLYCRFTHAAFIASTGNLANFEAEDNRTMALCACAAVDALTSLGVTAPNLPELMQRLSD